MKKQGKYILNNLVITESGKILEGSIIKIETNEMYHIGQKNAGITQLLKIDDKLISVNIKYGEFLIELSSDDIYIELTYEYKNKEFKIRLDKL